MIIKYFLNLIMPECGKVLLINIQIQHILFMNYYKMQMMQKQQRHIYNYQKKSYCLRKEYISTTNNKQFDLESALSAKFLRILNEEEKNDIMDFINQVNSRVKEEMIKKEAEDLLAKLGPEQLEELKKLLKDH